MTRTAPERRRALRAVIAWSWDLLDEPERIVLRRLSVFADGATASSAEAVCADDTLVAAEAVLDLAAALVDRSMVVLDRSRTPVRYRLLESVRAFAEDQLDRAGETHRVRERHAEHVLALVERTATSSCWAVRCLPRVRGCGAPWPASVTWGTVGDRCSATSDELGTEVLRIGTEVANGVVARCAGDHDEARTRFRAALERLDSPLHGELRAHVEAQLALVGDAAG